MTTTKEPKYVAETLAWCNKIRKQFGKRPLKELPKGYVANPRSCPCGEATGLEVMYSHAVPQGQTSFTPDAEYFPLPRSVQRFIRAFDHYKLPQYIKGGK